MVEPHTAVPDLATSAHLPSIALSSDGAILAVADGRGACLAGGPALAAAPGAIAIAVLEGAIWIVTRDASGHALQRFDVRGARIGAAVRLGELGDHVALEVNRIGARMALLEGERAVFVRERDGEVVVEQLGERRRDRRVLVGGRGVAERVGAAIRVRTGSMPPLVVPPDLSGNAIGCAGVVHGGQAVVVEMIGRDASTALLYDVRSGAVTKRIRLGALRVLAIAEHAGALVLGRDKHLAVLHLRAGRCTSEHILARAPVACAIDAVGATIRVVDGDGHVLAVDPAAPTDATESPEAAAASEGPPAPLARGSQPELATTTHGSEVATPARGSQPELARPTHGSEVAAPARGAGALAEESAPLPPPPSVPVPTTAPLCALAVAPAPASPPVGEMLDTYLDDLRAWVETLCEAACAARGTDDEAPWRERTKLVTDALAGWTDAGAPHAAIASELGLGPLATRILLLVAAPQIWGELANAYGACTNDRARPLVDELLLAHLLEANVAARSAIAGELDDSAPLVRSGAIVVARGLRPYAALSAHPVVARRLAGVVFAAAPADDVALADVLGPRAAIAALAGALVEPRREPVRVVIRGRASSGRRTLARALARRALREIAVVPATDPDTLLARLQHATLCGHLPCIVLDDLGDDLHARARVRSILDGHVGPLFAIAPRDVELPLSPGAEAIEIPPLTETERCRAWESHGIAPPVAAALASRFSVGAGPIVRAARTGRDEADLAQVLRGYRSARISAVAERVDERATWDELVVPADIDEALRELVSRVRHRRTVLETWGLSRVAATARGVTALFQGGPGTGKTMASGVIASALGYELWRVDLSKVVSKWIGETEKNLAAVFDAAEEGEIVLLFDEADSLFAKRTEVKSSSDKHGNVATNYLLQRLDTFTGVAILTTNFGSAIDPAFKRRISVQVQFPFPDEDDRERLWRAHLPCSLPTVGDLGLPALARQYQMSGGHIRNAVLRAAYLAADRDGAISAEHLIRAVALEKERTGKLGDGRIE